MVPGWPVKRFFRALPRAPAGVASAMAESGRRALLTVAALAAALGCVAGPPPPRPRPPMPPRERGEFSVVRVFYATDRAPTGSMLPAEMYGGARGIMAYGLAEVTIPAVHELGEVERPSLWRFEFREDPSEHIIVARVSRLGKDDFFRDLDSASRRSPDQSALVFVHGYNVDFAEALRRTAQIAFDIGFEGAPVLFSWPSQGNLAGYTRDEANIEWTEPHLRQFLRDLVAQTEVRTVHVIAHSMGTRALTRALAAGAESAARGVVIKNVILAAPDIDASVFKRDILPGLREAGARITLYASSEDEALKASKTVHGYPRLGDSGANLVLEQGLDTIDATHVDTGFLGHSYFSETRGVITDIRELVRSGLEPDRRGGLRRRNSGELAYWLFPD